MYKRQVNKLERLLAIKGIKKVDISAAKEELDKIKAQLEEAGDIEKAAAIEAAAALLNEAADDTCETDEEIIQGE